MGAMAERSINVLIITQASSESSICVVVPENEGDAALMALQETFELELARYACISTSKFSLFPPSANYSRGNESFLVLFLVRFFPRYVFLFIATRNLFPLFLFSSHSSTFFFQPSRALRSTISSVSLVKGMAIVAIVGEGMAFTSGVASTFMSSLATANVNIRLISQGLGCKVHALLYFC